MESSFIGSLQTCGMQSAGIHHSQGITYQTYGCGDMCSYETLHKKCIPHGTVSFSLYQIWNHFSFTLCYEEIYLAAERLFLQT